MGHFQIDAPISFGDAFHSTKLFWKFASQTRALVSALKADRIAKRKTSVPSYKKAEAWEPLNGGQYGIPLSRCCSNCRPSSKRSRRGSSRSKECYLCNVQYRVSSYDREETESAWAAPYPSGVPKRSSPASRPYPKPSSSKSLTSTKSNRTLVCPPITRCQPPILPMRTSSLRRHSKPQRLHLKSSAHLSIPMIPSTLSGKESFYFQYLVDESLCTAPDRLNNKFKDPIWRVILQAATSEPCIRSLALSTAMFHYSNSHVNSQAHRTKRSKTLQRRLAAIGKEAHSNMTWDVSFLSLYLFTVLQILLGNQTGALVCMKQAFKSMVQAIRFFGLDPERRELPGMMREVAMAFGRLSIKG